MIFFEPGKRNRTVFPHDPIKALIAPRPIGWISTVDADGLTNLAPYSFFNMFCSSPTIIGFSSEGMKDTLSLSIETGEFVWNLPTYGLRREVSVTSERAPRGVSEFELAGVEMAPSVLVRPPRVRASPAALECKVVDHIAIRDSAGGETGAVLTLGQVVGVHIDPVYVRNGQVDTAAMEPISRCGYRSDYAVTRQLFELTRPGT